MKDLIKNNYKNILFITVFLVLLFWGYGFLFGGDSNQALSVSAPAQIDSSVGQDLLLILAELRTLRLDDSVFTDKVFQSLKNFRVELSPEPVGRDNPFAPISGSSGGSNQGLRVRTFNTE